MALSDIVNVSISANTSSPTQPGFGTALIAGYHTAWVDRVRSYTGLDAMVSDGFTANSPEYKAASAIFSQNPRPERLKVGRRALPMTQVVTLTVNTAVAGEVLRVTLTNAAGVATTYTRTIPGASSVSAEATALAALIDAHANVAAVAVGAVITCTTGTAGLLIAYSAWSAGLTFADTSADPGLATDLAAIVALDDDWYALTLTTCSKTEILAGAAWTEARDKIMSVHSCDGVIIDSAVTTDVASTMVTSAYARTHLMYNGHATQDFTGAAMLGDRLPDAPGSDTWHLKTLNGVSTDVLTDTQQNNALTKRCNIYIALAGLNVSRGGISPAGEYLDVVRFRDWLKATMQTRVYALFANAKKVPFTDAGGDMIRAVMLGVLSAGVRAGGLVEGSTTVIIPLVSTISSVDKAARHFSGITFSGQLAGAIHKATLTGTLSL